MPIVDGRYEARMSTVFATPEEGIDAIKQKVRKSRKIRINCIPGDLLDELKPLLERKDLKIVLPLGEKPTDDLKELGEVASTKAKIYVDYHGEEANSGYITFPSVMFGVTWSGDKIHQISTMEYGPCVKCMSKGFEGAWRYAQKW
ncbi:MAG: hypothetical protein ACE5IJ_08290 [Thermoplasmata archaeon]